MIEGINILDLIIILGAIQGLIFSIYLLINPLKNKKASNFLSIFILAFAANSIYYTLDTIGLRGQLNAWDFSFFYCPLLIIISCTKLNTPVNYFRPQHDAILEQYIGNYDYEGQVLSITKDGEQLYAQTHPYPKVSIHSQSEEAFFYRIFDGRLKFNSENDEVLSVSFTGRDDVKLYGRITTE